MELPSLVAVLGLGVSGCAVAEVLLRRGIQVIAADEKPLEKLAQRERVQALAQQGAQLLLGGDAFERLRKWRCPSPSSAPASTFVIPKFVPSPKTGRPFGAK